MEGEKEGGKEGGRERRKEGKRLSSVTVSLTDLGMDDDDDEPVPLPNVNGAIMKKVLIMMLSVCLALLF